MNSVGKNDFIKRNPTVDYIFDHLPYGWMVHNKFYDVKRWFIKTYQRIRYGVSDNECWSLYATFTSFILPRLKHFKKMKRYTFPMGLTVEKWDEILDELIWTFEYIKDDGEQINPYPDLKNKDEAFLTYLNREKTSEEKEIMEKWYQKHLELEDRKRKGLELFAKYYDHLWD